MRDSESAKRASLDFSDIKSGKTEVTCVGRLLEAKACSGLGLSKGEGVQVSYPADTHQHVSLMVHSLRLWRITIG
jgi:hypothetical protein